MRVHNFSAGPAALPTAVLEQAQQELLDYQGLGYSVMEMGHRTEHFQQIAAQAEADLRQLLTIPDNYRVLFLAGGATLQFAMVAMHLLQPQQEADYIQTGIWSKKAAAEAAKYAKVNIVTNSETNQYTDIPARETWQLSPNARYCYYCDNETVNGIQFHERLQLGEVPLICDMTSSILTKVIDVSDFGIIFAGAQKNLGISGFSTVIIRDDLMESQQSKIPTVLHYASQNEASCMLNTPPTFAWYITGLLLQWVIKQGGVAAMEAASQRKAQKVYEVLDADNFYITKVQSAVRSTVNPIFALPTAELEAKFLAESHAAGLVSLKGHRVVGGLRASLYNAVSEQAVSALVDFMEDFAKRYG